MTSRTRKTGHSKSTLLFPPRRGFPRTGNREGLAPPTTPCLPSWALVWALKDSSKNHHQTTLGRTPATPGVKADSEPWRYHLHSTPVLWAGAFLPGTPLGTSLPASHPALSPRAHHPFLGTMCTGNPPATEATPCPTSSSPYSPCRQLA